MECHRGFHVHDQPEDNLEDYVLHAWESELLDGHLDSVLDLDAHMELIDAVVLHTYHQIQLKAERSRSVLLYKMDQVVEDRHGEVLYVLDNQHNGFLVAIGTVTSEEVVHSIERLGLENIALFHVLVEMQEIVLICLVVNL